jgi:hypothetical protein
MKTHKVEVQLFRADGRTDAHNEAYRNSCVSAPQFVQSDVLLAENTGILSSILMHRAQRSILSAITQLASTSV